MAEWVDVDSHRSVRESLTALGFKTKAEAIEWLKKKSEELRRAKLSRELGIQTAMPPAAANIEQTRQAQTLREVLSAYVKHYSTDRAQNLTQRQDERLKAFRDFATKLGFLDRPAGEFLPVFLTDFRDDLARLTKFLTKGKRKLKTSVSLSTGARNSYLSTTKAFCNWARQRGYLPFTGDDVADRLKNFRGERKLPTTLRVHELQSLIVSAVDNDLEMNHSSRRDKAAYGGDRPSRTATAAFEPLAPLVLILALTGMRRGEALHLRWENVDFERGIIEVKFDAESGWRVKTRHERRIPLEDSPALLALLRGLHASRGRSTYVVSGEDPKRPKNFRAAAWRRIARAAGSPAMTPKHLRATFASALAAADRAPHL